jgi:succinate dehydrogenase / fumarate reductase flavoprotein subunit
MQGLADGYFVIPYTVGAYLAGEKPGKVTTDHPAFAEAEGAVRVNVAKLLQVKGKKTVREFHWELGRLMWDHVGMSRTKEGLAATREKIRALREEFWRNVDVLGEPGELNQNLEMAGRVADYLELGELMCIDAWHRDESCGGHFREEYRTAEGEAQRSDEKFAYVAAWEHTGQLGSPRLHKEPLDFPNVHLAQRNYK